MVAISAYICSAVLIFVTVLFDIAQVGHLFLLFKCDNLSADFSTVKCLIYAMLILHYIAPFISVAAILLSCCFAIPAIVLYVLCVLVNVGAIAYHAAYFVKQLDKNIPEATQLAQLIVPIVLMSGVILMNLILAIDTCVMYLRKKVASVPEKGSKKNVSYSKLDSEI